MINYKLYISFIFHFIAFRIYDFYIEFDCYCGVSLSKIRLGLSQEKSFKYDLFCKKIGSQRFQYRVKSVLKSITRYKKGCTLPTQELENYLET